MSDDKYMITNSAKLSDLVEHVNELIKEGWKPLGSPLFDGYMYIQALEKD